MSISEAETLRFSRFFVAPARSVLTSCEVYKTLAGATFFTHRSLRARTPKQRKIVLRACSTVLDAPNALGHRSGAVRERLRSGPRTLLDVSWPLLARPGSLKIGLWVAFGRPQAVPSASRRVPETALSAQNRPRAIFRRFLDDLARFFVDFRSIFRRIS